MGTMEGTKHNFILYREQSTASTFDLSIFIVRGIYKLCDLYNF